MIRQRVIGALQFLAGGLQIIDLPRDAVYHMIQLSCYGGTWVSTQGALGTGPILESTFPFALFRSIRLIRNGSDVVFQGSGAQLAKEHYYLNHAAPFARMYTVTANVETLLIATSRGVTQVPATSDGINANVGLFAIPAAPAATATIRFDFELELWLQMGPDDIFYGTLIDARKLASFQLEILWQTVAGMSVPGTANTADAITANVTVTSIDQDNLSVDEAFGTFKRSTMQITNAAYGVANFQVLLPRGNYFHGIIFQTRAFKAASAIVMEPENEVIHTLINRINSNFQLRNIDWKTLQAINMSDNGGLAQPWSLASGHPQGWACLYYPSASNEGTELVPTFTMDQFDLQLTIDALANASNGVTTAATLPAIDMLLEEVIPAVDMGKSAPRGAKNGSIRGTSAKPYSK